MFEKEAEEWWYNEYSPSLYDNVSKVWQQGAEFGYSKIEKIAELERFIKTQDRKLRQQSKECDKAINRVEILEKENAELKEKLEGAEKARDYWKDSSFDWRHKCTSRKPFKAAVKAQKQLTKAKEIIRDLLSCLYSVEYDRVSDLEQAEQFLK